MKTPLFILLLLTFCSLSNLTAQIYSNGPYYNSTGTGSGGANESVLQTTTLGMSTIGFGQQATSFNRIADDFTIDCKWTIDSIHLYGYQTGSTTTSTFTGYNLRIWDGVPDAVGSNVVFGDTATNRLIYTTWSGAYRITQTTTGNTSRPIMRNTLQVGVTLPAGTYYLDWAATGSLASGPWQVPIVINGQAVTGNGRQRIGSTWNNLVDGGTGTPAQGVPFDLFGTTATVTANAGMDASICENTAFILGGTPTGTSSESSPLSYSWSNIPSVDSTQSNPLVTVTDTIQFTVIVTDTNGCTATDTVLVTSLTPEPVTISLNNFSFCPGSSTTLVADQSTGLAWITGETNDSIVVNTPGNYHVQYTDGNGCFSFDTVSVSEFTAPTVLGPDDMNICLGDTLVLDATGADSYVWNDSIANGTSVYPSQTTTFTVVGLDSNGCSNSDSFTVNVFEATNNTITVTGLDSIQVNSEMYYQDGTYTQTLTNANGCDSILTVIVELDFTSVSDWDNNVSVSPNPMNEILHVQLMNGGEQRFKLITIMGQIVSEFTVSGSETIDVSHLSTGSYLIVNESTKQRLLLIKN